MLDSKKDEDSSGSPGSQLWGWAKKSKHTAWLHQQKQDTGLELCRKEEGRKGEEGFVWEMSTSVGTLTNQTCGSRTEAQGSATHLAQDQKSFLYVSYQTALASVHPVPPGIVRKASSMLGESPTPESQLHGPIF